MLLGRVWGVVVVKVVVAYCENVEVVVVVVIVAYCENVEVVVLFWAALARVIAIAFVDWVGFGWVGWFVV